MGEWKEIKFSDFAEVNPAISLSRTKEHFYIEMQDMDPARRWVSPKRKRPLQGGSRFADGDTLFARISPCTEKGNINQVSGLDGEHGYGSTEFLVFRERPGISDKDFLIYFSKWSEIKDYAANNLQGTSGRQRVAKEAFDELEVVVPPLPEQRAIALVLSSLDAKIDLLHRQNKTLEGMAEALFREWFGEGGGLGGDGGGKEGWVEYAIEGIATRVACGPFGSSIKTDTFVSEGVPIISGQHLWGVLLEDNTFNYITPDHAEKLSKAKVQRGDVIFTHAGSIGQAALIPQTSRYEEYVLSQRQFFMRCDRSKVVPLYVVMYFHTREGKHQLLGNTSTSGVPSIARPVSFLRSLFIPVPPLSIQQEFERVVGSLYDKVQANNRTTNSLEKIRDTLLPKLMSGEVRVEL